MKLNHVSVKDLRLRLTHQRLGGALQRDLVAYAYIDPNNTIQLDLDWNPDLWEIFILNSTNLITEGYVHEIAEDVWQALVDVITRVFDEARSNIEKLFDMTKVQSLWHDLLLDLRAISETLRRWREKDEFHLQTWNVTLVNNVIDADIVRLDKNVRTTILKQVNDVRASLQRLMKSTKWIDSMISRIKREIINRRYLNIRPVLRKIFKHTNTTRINLEKLTKSAFHQAASGVFAVYRIRMGFLNWFSEIHQSAQKVFHDLLTNVLYKVSSRMLTDSVDVGSIMAMTQDIGTILNWALETGVSFVRVMLTKQYLRDNESDRMLTLINSGEFNEASRIFFQSEKNHFMYDLDKGILRFGVHLPHLLKEWYEAACTLATVSRRVTSYVFPGPGILSLMYTYDQYQRRFDALRKLPKMLPPYSATAWIMLGDTRGTRAQVMTFNGGYLSLERPTAVTSRTNGITYLLLRDTAGRGEIRCTILLADDVWLLGFEVGRLHLQITDNKTVSQRIANKSFQLLTLPYTVLEGQHVISLHRQINRLHVDLRRRQGDEEVVLILSIVVEFSLRQLEFTLSGWWHGKCDGLLGRHGFDKLLDRIGPERGEHVKRSRVATLWAYSQQGHEPGAIRTHQINSTTVRPSLHNKLRVQCLNYFKKQSSCVFAVPPTSWMDACFDLDWLPGGSTDSMAMQLLGEHVCRIAKAYTRACNLKGISIRVPGKCIQCDPDMRSDGSRKHIVPKTGENRLHISFILQLGECFSDRIEELKELLFRLQRGNLQSIRYSAILYDKFKGLPDISWVTSESGSTIIFSSDTLLEALKSVYGTLVHEVNHNKSINIDSDRALEALSMTIRQPVTLEAVKETILLITCDRCSVSIPQDYGKIYRMLTRKGMTFHYLPYTSFVKFGGFSSTAFMLTSDNLIGELRSEAVVEGPNAARVVLPKDQCSIIAENSNGFIWAYRSVVKSDYMKRRTVLTSLASRLLQWQILPKLCHCRDNMHGDGIIDCIVKP